MVVHRLERRRERSRRTTAASSSTSRIGSTADGTKLQQWTATGGTNQLFKVQDVHTGAYTWKNVAIGGGGFVTGIVFSPAQSGLAYARTDVGGFYRWNDANEHLDPADRRVPGAQGNNLGGESIAADPVNAEHRLRGGRHVPGSGNGVILRSTDQGNTWTVNNIGVPMGGNENGRGMGERLAVDPNNNAILFFGSRTQRALEEHDSGATWARVTGFPTTGDASYGLPVVVFDKRGGSSRRLGEHLRRRGLEERGQQPVSHDQRRHDVGAASSGGPSGPDGPSCVARQRRHVVARLLQRLRPVQHERRDAGRPGLEARRQHVDAT